MTEYTFAHPSFAGRIGVAREDITPPLGIYARNWGAAKHDVASGVHRPLTLTALTFAKNEIEPPLVLMALDLGWWRSRDDEEFVRFRVLDALQLHSSRLMMCLSHTHAGPVLARAESEKPGGEHIAPYLENLAAAAIRATQNALQEAKPRVLDWSYGFCNLATNRDLPDPNDANGKRVLVGFNPRGESDATLLVGRVYDEFGETLRATIVNYACHPTTLAWENSLISPDYVGAMRQVVEEKTAAPCAFLQGASGELAPREQYVGDAKNADKNGRALGFAVLSTLESMSAPQSVCEYSHEVSSGANLGVWRVEERTSSTRCAAMCREIELELKSDWPTVAQIESEIAACDATQNRAEIERLNRRLQTRRSLGDGSTAKMPLWAWRLGDAVLIGQANEAYSLWQRELRARFPHLAVAAMNVVNGWYGYLPPREMYQKEIYSAWQTPFAAGGLEKLIEESARLVQQLNEP